MTPIATSTRRNTLHATLLLVLCAALTAGCHKKSDSAAGPTSRPAGKLKIAAILMQQDQFFRLNELGMKDAAKKADVELPVSNAESKQPQEIALVDTYIESKVDAILVSPLKPTVRPRR